MYSKKHFVNLKIDSGILCMSFITNITIQTTFSQILTRSSKNCKLQIYFDRKYYKMIRVEYLPLTTNSFSINLLSINCTLFSSDRHYCNIVCKIRIAIQVQCTVVFCLKHLVMSNKTTPYFLTPQRFSNT